MKGLIAGMIVRGQRREYKPGEIAKQESRKLVTPEDRECEQAPQEPQERPLYPEIRKGQIIAWKPL